MSTVPTPRRSFLVDGSFWIAATERAIKTGAQAGIPIFTASATGLVGIDYLAALSLTGAAVAISYLSSIAIGAATDGSPSLGTEKLTH